MANESSYILEPDWKYKCKECPFGCMTQKVLDSHIVNAHIKKKEMLNKRKDDENETE